MRKLLKGIVEFRRNSQDDYREKFGPLATGQAPDALFFACSDSRVVPNVFASTDPGDLFVIRNVGNLIPPCGADGVSISDESEAAAIEFAVLKLAVSDIIICGHSDCGAMHALLNDRTTIPAHNLQRWLRHGEAALDRLRAGHASDPTLSEQNQLSQINVLAQVEHVKTYPVVQERMAQDGLRLHAWWFDIGEGDVYAFEEDRNRYVLLDEAEAGRIVSRMSK